jgi:hypothetical protein
MVLMKFLAQAKLSPPPLLNFGIIYPGDSGQYFVPKFRNSKICVGAEKFCKLSLALVGINLEGLKGGVEEIYHERVVGHRDFLLSLEEL